MPTELPTGVWGLLGLVVLALVSLGTLWIKGIIDRWRAHSEIESNRDEQVIGYYKQIVTRLEKQFDGLNKKFEGLELKHSKEIEDLVRKHDECRDREAKLGSELTGLRARVEYMQQEIERLEGFHE